MSLDWKKIGIVVGVLVFLLLIFLGALWLRGKTSPGTPPQTGNGFTEAPRIGSSVFGTVASSSLPIFGSDAAVLSVFKIADGPVVSGTLLQTGTPTSTIARYVTAGDGHVIEVALGVPGVAPHIVSNTTIPGVVRALWSESGKGVLLQYLAGNAVKTLHVSLSSAGTTSSTPSTLRFLPEGIIDLAVAPDGKQIAYLLQSSSGVDGYIAKPDGTGAKKLFSIPLSQLLLSWPSQKMLLAQQKSAVGILGVAFSIDSQTGAVVELLSGNGLMVSADPTFSYLLYQTNDGSGGSTYVARLSPADTKIVAFQPLAPALPEQCIWERIATTTRAYCAAAKGAVPADFADRFHRGELSYADAFVAINPTTGFVIPVVSPGEESGEPSNMINFALSIDGKFASFVSKDNRSFWGIRLR